MFLQSGHCRVKVLTMDLTTVFKLSIYGLTAAVGLVLGTAERGWIPFVSLPMTLIGYWWCEGGFSRKARQETGLSANGLSDTSSLVCGGLSLMAATTEFFSNNPEGKLLSGIHLVVYLTWIVLLQRKQQTRYWQLLVLGVLQVAVASVLTNGTWFGLSVLVYLVASTWTLSVFSLFRAAEEFGEDRRDAERASRSSSSPLPIRDAVAGDSRTARLRSRVIGAVCSEDGEQWITWRFVSGVGLCASLGLIVGAMFFAFIPRLWVGTSFGLSDDELPPTLRRTITGLSNEIRLGDMRPILESNDPVLALRLIDNQTGQRLDPFAYAERLGHPEPLFRGVMLVNYEAGRWWPNRLASEQTERLFINPSEPAPGTAPTPVVRQEIRLEPIGNDILFCQGRAIAMRDSENFRCGQNRYLEGIAIRRDWFKELSGPVDYIAFSELPAADNVGDTSYVVSRMTHTAYRVSEYLKRCTEIPDTLERLVAHARQVIETEQRRVGRKLTQLEQARAIESHLRDSGLYSYSLIVQPPPPKVDPVEDFLFERRAGHCQYFASSLGLMLRSVGIPARLVTGFKGGEIQPNGLLRVEKRYSHAWVEAWIDNKKWVTFDAVPESQRTASVTAIGAQRGIWSAMSSSLSGAWEANVLNISLERQEELFYRPMREWIAALSARESALAFLTSPVSSVRNVIVFLSNPRNWLTLPGAITLAMLFGLLWLLRRGSLRLSLAWGWRRSLSDTSRHRRVEFYERFARLMQSHGEQRQPAETQSEFIHAVAQRLAVRLRSTESPHNNAPQRESNSSPPCLTPIGDLFYRVRFGDEVLPVEEANQMNELLTQLEQTLGPGSSKLAQSR